jgi:hypothetical protein
MACEQLAMCETINEDCHLHINVKKNALQLMEDAAQQHRCNPLPEEEQKRSQRHETAVFSKRKIVLTQKQ